MTAIRHVRAGLKGRKPDEEILIAWWDKEWFEEMLDTKLTDEQWHNVIRRCEKTMEFCGWADDLTYAAEEALRASTDDEVPA